VEIADGDDPFGLGSWCGQWERREEDRKRHQGDADDPLKRGLCRHRPHRGHLSHCPSERAMPLILRVSGNARKA
jgi:hypothetical protein